ncbi:MAG: hypothetical protein ACRD5G_16315, partial [Candidatus Acidiferrales bacterium]
MRIRNLAEPRREDGRRPIAVPRPPEVKSQRAPDLWPLVSDRSPSMAGHGPPVTCATIPLDVTFRAKLLLGF